MIRRCKRCLKPFTRQTVRWAKGYPSLVRTIQQYCPACQAHVRWNALLQENAARHERARLSYLKARKP